MIGYVPQLLVRYLDYTSLSTFAEVRVFSSASNSIEGFGRMEAVENLKVQTGIYSYDRHKNNSRFTLDIEEIIVHAEESEDYARTRAKNEVPNAGLFDNTARTKNYIY